MPNNLILTYISTEQGSTVTFLLRNPSVFDSDTTIQKYVQSGSARLIKGDAMNLPDVQAVWAAATKDAPVDLLLFTIGGAPGAFHPLKGFTVETPNLCTASLLNFLCAMPQKPDGTYPKVIALSTSGSTVSSRKQVPLLMKPAYGWMIQGAVRDKLGMERVLAYVAGREWNPIDGEPLEEITGKDWKNREGLPKEGSVKDSVLLRAAMLTDGECLADKAVASGKKLPYRTGPEEVGGYTVSRKDVAHFIVEGILKNWDQWKTKQISIAY